ncbi:MAG: hypothetical protein CMF50_08360 [Legionellales bacterium]|nr:hypothetical protein [Legionellales bacterium]|tara:strand:+ start:23464 stop:25086 length:1623 start_codon:yes stop_codon:yes gene_type:complete
MFLSDNRQTAGKQYHELSAQQQELVQQQLSHALDRAKTGHSEQDYEIVVRRIGDRPQLFLKHVQDHLLAHGLCERILQSLKGIGCDVADIPLKVTYNEQVVLFFKITTIRPKLYETRHAAATASTSSPRSEQSSFSDLSRDEQQALQRAINNLLNQYQEYGLPDCYTLLEREGKLFIRERSQNPPVGDGKEAFDLIQSISSAEPTEYGFSIVPLPKGIFQTPAGKNIPAYQVTCIDRSRLAPAASTSAAPSGNGDDDGVAMTSSAAAPTPEQARVPRPARRVAYNNLGRKQKDYLKAKLVAFLLTTGLIKYYTIMRIDDKLYISEIRQPSDRAKRAYTNFRDQRIQLKKKGEPVTYIIADSDIKEVPSPRGKIAVKVYEVTDIDPNRLPLAQATPHGVDNAVWGPLDPLITSNWNEFSSELRQHIIACQQFYNDAARQPENIYSDGALRTKLVGDNAHCAITCDTTTIPVRLPNATLGHSNEVYDLVSVLQFSGIDPMTRATFTLDQVIPDTEALAERQALANNGGGSATSSGPGLGGRR